MRGEWRFLKFFCVATVAVLGVSVVLAMQPQQRPMPRDQWIVDWGDQRCTLMRRSGGDVPVTLGIRINPGFDSAEIFLADAAWTRGSPRLPRNIDIVFRPSGERLATPATIGRVPDTRQPGLTMWNVDRRFYDLFAASQRIDFQADGQVLTGMAVRGTEAAIRALRRCQGDLLAGWGIDPGLMNSLQSRPEPLTDAAQWIRSEDYPTAALRAEQEGLVIFRFVVGTDGRARDCTIVRSSGHQILDRRSCELWLDRARYRPAIGADGEAVAVPQVMTSRWYIFVF